jgi:phosphohistidine phosphatase
MDIIFLRHAIAISREEPDCPAEFDRFLTPEGRKKMEKETAGIRALGLQFDVVLSSPLVRAHQTAEIVLRALSPTPPFELCDALRPGKTPSILIRQLRNYPEDARVLLVGHEPDLSHQIGLFAFGRIIEGFGLKKGAMACVRVSQWEPAPRGEFKWLLTPKLLIAAGRG